MPAVWRIMLDLHLISNQLFDLQAGVLNPLLAQQLLPVGMSLGLLRQLLTGPVLALPVPLQDLHFLIYLPVLPANLRTSIFIRKLMFTHLSQLLLQ